uniref:Uncharacterized protein n=1 Tax=Solanum lycopersicum TaxID=4081 RepID=A0A3Q7I6R4_SOLLC
MWLLHLLVRTTKNNLNPTSWRKKLNLRGLKMD